MPEKRITLGNKRITLRKAIVEPDYLSKTVLVDNTWQYVRLWLDRNKKVNALFYWEQAEQFHRASTLLPNTASPVTWYYCFLNASKALLSAHGMPTPPLHGVRGRPTSKRANLSSEEVKFLGHGILGSLCQYFSEAGGRHTYSLSDILYNLVYIHRAYNLTFSSRPELFTPIADPIFVKRVGSIEAWFKATITDERYANKHTLKKLPTMFEIDPLSEDGDCQSGLTVRLKRHFNWRHGKAQKQGNLNRLLNYHRRIRKTAYYIYGPNRLWYVKRRPGLDGMIQRNSITLTFAAMHRLSEMARYEPMILDHHFKARHNWLISEFISRAPVQFIDEISSEITGQDFMPPGVRTPK